MLCTNNIRNVTAGFLRPIAWQEYLFILVVNSEKYNMCLLLILWEWLHYTFTHLHLVPRF